MCNIFNFRNGTWQLLQWRKKDNNDIVLASYIHLKKISYKKVCELLINCFDPY